MLVAGGTGDEMTRNMSVVLYIVALIVVVVIVDLLFFKNQFWERLIVNIGIVLVFVAFYLRLMKDRKLSPRRVSLALTLRPHLGRLLLVN
jgi:uncharacterized membrane protein